MSDFNLGVWSEKHTRYVKPEDGEPIICVFKRAEPFVDKENEDTEKVRYYLEIDGNEKLLESQSAALAGKMSGVEPGTKISITRTGKGRQTSYEVAEA